MDRDFRSAVMKVTHTALALYAPVPPEDTRGVVRCGGGGGGGHRREHAYTGDLVISSRDYTARSRSRKRRGGRGRGMGRGQDSAEVKAESVFSYQYAGSTSCRGGRSSCHDECSCGGTSKHLPADVQKEAHDHSLNGSSRSSSSGGGGGGDDGDHILASSFSSHKHMLYTHEVLKRNYQSLRRPYLHLPSSPSLPVGGGHNAGHGDGSGGSGNNNEFHEDESSPGVPSHVVNSADTDMHTDMHTDTHVPKSSEQEAVTTISLPLLADIFPSMSLLSNLVMFLPLRNTLTCTQQTSVNVLHERFHLLQHFSFLQSVFLLGEVSTVFASLREQLFADSGASSSSAVGRYRPQHQQYHHTNMLRAISDSVMLRISQYLPENFSESLVSVTFAASSSPTTTDHNSSNNTPTDVHSASNSSSGSSSDTPNALPLGSSGGYSQAERLFLSLDHLLVQIHYPPPLSDVLPPPAVSTYNTHLQFLLKITLCCWASEKLWKLSTGSGSFLTQLCSSRRHRQGRPGAAALSSSYSDSDLDSKATLRHLHRTCMTGLQWVIFVSRALESFYLHEVHHVQWQQFRDTLHSSSATVMSSSQSLGDGNDASISISTLAERHELYLNRVSSCVHFLQAVVLGAVQASVSALGVFEEAHVAAEANKTLLSERERDMDRDREGSSGRGSGRGSGGKEEEGADSATLMVHKIICSRLSHAANKMKLAQESIVSLVDGVEGLYQQHQQHQQDLTADDVRHVTALRSLLGHISHSGGID